MSTPAIKERFEDYRRRGWWPGERLEQCYERHALARPEGLAVADSTGRRLSHAQLWQRAGELAARLAKGGISAGDVLLLFLPNRVEWQIGLLAALRVNAVPASIPTKTDAKTLAYAADLVRCKALLTSANKHGDELLETASSAATDFAGGLPILCIAADGVYDWIGNGKQRDVMPELVDGLDHIMFTSSTTGLPKAVMHTTDTLAALNIQFSERFSLGPDTPIFMSSPLGHSVGGIHGARLALHTGTALVLQETWEPPLALQMIDEYQCAFTAAATPFLKDLLDIQESGNSHSRTSLGTFLCGGAPVPPALIEEAWRAFPDTFFTNLWGMTEGGLVTCVSDSPRAKLIETAGIGLPDLELRVLDDVGNVLDSGLEGELAMRGPGVFVGYYGQDDLYQSLLTPDGFFRTGDLAQIDDEGYVRITGRLKDLIIRGGVNISPLPAEDILAAHPKLRSVAVVGFPDERLGERICAVVEPGDEKPTLDELIRFAADGGLPKRQLPELIRYVDAMPRTAAGKIRKPVLQDLIRRAAPEQLDLSDNDAG
jgi:acyl-CoA synthetase (AMP-forming)/AMP-acid ligase II